VRKLVGENTRFIYGIGGQLIAEFDGSTGNLKKEYVEGGATLIRSNLQRSIPTAPATQLRIILARRAW